jgi:DNA-binding NtrC family response regulator
MTTAQTEPRPLVLVVEEETHERVFIASHLIEAGYEVIEAEDTDTALRLVESRSELKALVTDAHVPGNIDGHELACEVRTRWPRVGVVLMSGHSDASSGPLPEGSEFVAKPHLTSRLVPALQALLGGGT